ncbi:MAG: copper chaperone PCu(A)C [Rhizobiales bacterium]|nr:copper chaperone PCu(A)C [Hyphomicrobiales bacterium]
MRNIILQFAAAIALTLAAILALAPGARASDITVSGAFARASATPAAKTGAVYATIRNAGAEADVLLGAQTAAAAMAMLHATEIIDGVASMKHLDKVEVGAGSEVKLRPLGTHIMLMGLNAPLKEGDSIPLVLEFEKAGKVEVAVPVGGVASVAPAIQ